MIAKLITYGNSREAAISEMKKALRGYKIVGLNNNLKFLKRVFEDSVFRGGDYDTGFIEQRIDSLLKKDENVDSFDLVTAVVARTAAYSDSLGLPRDLLGYRNVPTKETHTIAVSDTSLAK